MGNQLIDYMVDPRK